jgi:hypothetical protein
LTPAATRSELAPTRVKKFAPTRARKFAPTRVRKLAPTNPGDMLLKFVLYVLLM